MVTVDWMEEVVLHVDNDQHGSFGIDYESSVVADLLVALDDHPPCGSSGEIELFGGWEIKPLVVSTTKRYLRSVQDVPDGGFVLFFFGVDFGSFNSHLFLSW